MASGRGTGILETPAGTTAYPRSPARKGNTDGTPGGAATPPGA